MFFQVLIHNYIMFVKFRFKGETLWLRVWSVIDETVVGRVWNHPFNRGVIFGQKIEIPIHDILDISYKD